jgi:predicted phage tail protein
MTKVVLYGSLKKKYGESYNLCIDTAAEAFVALGEQLPGFYQDIYEGSWCIKRGDTFLSEEVLSIGMGDEELHIMPSAIGAKSEWIPIIIGVALMFAVGPMAGNAFGAILKGTAELTMLQSVAFGVGASLALGGVAQMLFSPTLGGDAGDREDNGVRKNGIFGGDWNLTKEGQIVPLIYGRMRVGSMVVQNALRTEDYNIALEIDPINSIDKQMITNDTTLTLQSGEGVSSTLIGFQTAQTYVDYKIPGSSVYREGSGNSDNVISALTMTSPGFGSIDSNNVAWSKQVRGVFERVETKDGVDTLYLCAIFTDLDNPRNIINDGFLRELKITDSTGVDVIDVATRGEDDLVSYHIKETRNPLQDFLDFFGDRGDTSWKRAEGYSRISSCGYYEAITDITKESYVDEGKYFYEGSRVDVDNTYILTIDNEVDPDLDYLVGPFIINNEDYVIAEWNLTQILAGNPTTHQLSLDTTYTVSFQYGR